MNIFITILSIIMSSAVIAAVIDWTSRSKKNQLDHITGERSIWRKEMKECLEGFQTCKIKNMDRWLTKLKANLNGYGYHHPGKYPEDIYLNIFRDEHIWKLIDQLDKERRAKMPSKEKMQICNEKIIHSVIALLKFDWERSKMETRSNLLAIFFWAVVSAYILFVCYLLFNVLHGKGLGINQIIIQWIIFSGWILVSCVLMWLPYVSDQIKTLRGAKWYKKVFSPLRVWIAGCALAVIINMVLFYLICPIVLLPLFLLFIFSMFIPVYYLSKRHTLYTDYDQIVMDILETDTLILYGDCTDSITNRFMIDILNRGLNFKMESNMSSLSEDEKFIQFQKDHPRCKKFIRYKKGEEMKYGPANNKTIKEYGL